MKLAPYLLGVISAQGSGDYDYGVVEDEGERGYGYDGGYGGGSSYGGSSYGGSYDTGYGGDSYSFNYGSGRGALTVHAVTCWESNHMGTHGVVDGDHTNHFFNSYDTYGWHNVHHGHETSLGTQHVFLPGTTNTYAGTYTNNAIDYHSELAFDHRLSGCIYEASGWDYTALTYNRYHTMTYGTTGLDTSNGNLYPVWWHYFNAHVLPGGSTQAHKLVMANPTYEGLGYLNFIVTFLKAHTPAIADREMDAQDHNTDDAAHTDLYSNGDAFTLTLNNDSTNPCSSYTNAGSAANLCWYSLYGTGSSVDWSSSNIAISSFPHNDLGKDFRFNLRILHHMGEGDSQTTRFYDSYYWYRVNRITIAFPYIVGCPLEISGSSANDSNASNGNRVIHKCMDSAGLNGHVFWHDSGDGSSNAAGAGHGTRSPKYIESFTDSSSNAHNKFIGLCVDPGTSHTTWVHGQHYCGDGYTVKGLMNAYDEYAQQEFGTHQEHWFQFYYKFSYGIDTTLGSNANSLDSEDLYIYNYPNKLFNAFEVTTVTINCDEPGTNNNLSKNQCLGTANSARAHEYWQQHPHTSAAPASG